MRIGSTSAAPSDIILKVGAVGNPALPGFGWDASRAEVAALAPASRTLTGCFRASRLPRAFPRAEALSKNASVFSRIIMKNLVHPVKNAFRYKNKNPRREVSLRRELKVFVIQSVCGWLRCHRCFAAQAADHDDQAEQPGDHQSVFVRLGDHYQAQRSAGLQDRVGTRTKAATGNGKVGAEGA